MVFGLQFDFNSLLIALYLKPLYRNRHILYVGQKSMCIRTMLGLREVVDVEKLVQVLSYLVS